MKQTRSLYEFTRSPKLPDFTILCNKSAEPVSSKRYKLACAPIQDCHDQPAPPHSLIGVCNGLSLGSQGPTVSSWVKLRFQSDCRCAD